MAPDILKSALAHLVSQNVLALQGNEYRSEEGHRLSFYLGKPGQAMILGSLESVELRDDLIVLVRSSDFSTLILGYDSVHGVCSTPIETTKRRTGFS